MIPLVIVIGWLAMVPMSSPDSALFNSHERGLLLKIARESINYGLDHGVALSVDVDDYTGPLRHDGCLPLLSHHRHSVGAAALNPLHR